MHMIRRHDQRSQIGKSCHCRYTPTLRLQASSHVCGSWWAGQVSIFNATHNVGFFDICLLLAVVAGHWCDPCGTEILDTWTSSPSARTFRVSTSSGVLIHPTIACGYTYCNNPSLQKHCRQSWDMRTLSTILYPSIRPSVHPSIHPSIHPSFARVKQENLLRCKIARSTYADPSNQLSFTVLRQDYPQTQSWSVVCTTVIHDCGVCKHPVWRHASTNALEDTQYVSASQNYVPGTLYPPKNRRNLIAQTSPEGSRWQILGKTHAKMPSVQNLNARSHLLRYSRHQAVEPQVRSNQRVPPKLLTMQNRWHTHLIKGRWRISRLI